MLSTWKMLWPDCKLLHKVDRCKEVLIVTEVVHVVRTMKLRIRNEDGAVLVKGDKSNCENWSAKLFWKCVWTCLNTIDFL